MRKFGRREHSQRIMAAIDRKTNEARIAAQIRTGITIDAEAARDTLAAGGNPLQKANA